MTIREIPLYDATDDQLREYGQKVLGLPINNNWKRETMLAKIQEARPGIDMLHLEVDDNAAPAGTPPPPPPEAAAQAQMQAAEADEDKWVTIYLSADKEKGGDRDLPVGVNGEQMTIPRNKEVAIPYRYYEALKNTSQTVYDTDADGNIIYPPRTVQRFNVSHVQDGIKPGVLVAKTKKARPAPAAAA